MRPGIYKKTKNKQGVIFILLLEVESTLTCFLMALIIVGATVIVFAKITKYNDWKEIASGNVAASLALGGKILGVSNIIHFAIITNNSPVYTIIWGLIGAALLIFIYLLFEWLTPKLNINKEIAAGNVAVGLLSAVFSVAASFIVGASIS